MIKRFFVPGQEWIYYKLYCSPRVADKILVKAIHPLVIDLKERNLIYCWFYIRYRDPSPHLRVRFKIREDVLFDQINTLLLAHLECFIYDEFIQSIQLDTYVRELERYGANTIELCEEIFSLDSEIVLSLLNLGLEDEYLVHFVLGHIITYLDIFELSYEEKLQFIKAQKEAFYTEFAISGKKKLVFRKKFDRHADFLQKNFQDIAQFSSMIRMFSEIRIKMNQIAPFILSRQQDRSFVLDSILPSLIHMSINRVYRDEQRLFETLCYDFSMRKMNRRV